MNARTLIERMGFDAGQLNYTLRTAVAACCAVALAWLIGLEHPQWSGMTVWAASQPMRGQLLEKSLFRMVGTIVGSVLGILLLVVAQGETWVIVIGLSLWVGLCAGLANLVRGFVSYGLMLAGYSAAMVTLLHSPAGNSDLALGIDRMLTVLLGVLVALAAGWLFAGRTDHPGLVRRAYGLTGRVLLDLAAHLSGARSEERQEHQRLLAEMAALDDELDGHAAGSLRSRQAVRAIRQLLSAHVALLLWMRRPYAAGGSVALADALREAASAIGADDSGSPERALRRAQELAALNPTLADALAGLTRAIAGQRAMGEAGAVDTGPQHPVVLHQDWIGARETLLRTGGVTLTAGLVWLLTGWQAGAFLMLGTAIMTTVFSTMDNPVQTLRFVIIGQIAGAAGALICRWLVWPAMTGEAGLVLAMMPFILLGGLVFAHRRTAAIGFDYNMVLLLLLQPTLPLSGSVTGSFTMAGAVVLGPLIALLSYRLIFPIDGHRRLRTLIVMMVHEIEAMAARRDASRHRLVWRARLYHRVLRLVRWAEKTGSSKEPVIEGSFAVLQLGSAILHIDEVLGRAELQAGSVKRLNAIRARLCKVGSDPSRAARMLTAAAARLVREPAIDQPLLREATIELAKQEAFFRAARPG